MTRYIKNNDFLEGRVGVDNYKRLSDTCMQIFYEEDTWIVVLHDTVIVKRYGNTYELNSGGWKTVTTKKRMNEVLPLGWHVYQEHSVWYLYSSLFSKSTYTFKDGMTIDVSTGTVTGAMSKWESGEQKYWLKAINKFVAKIDTLPSIPRPSSGDCWYCSMMDRVEEAGQRSENPDHLRKHVQQGYLHGTLICNALLWAGYGEHQLGIQYGMNCRTNIKNALRRYLKAQLI